MSSVTFHPVAEAELQAGIAWYTAISPQLGDRFNRAVDAARAAIAQTPTLGAECDRDHRRYPLKKFPYGLVYRFVGADILVVSVSHNNQRPGSWSGRA